MAMILCPECGQQVSDKATHCPNCGSPVAMMFCKFCGEKIDSDCVVCPKCGKQVKELNSGNSGNIVINNSVSSSAAASASVGGYKGKEKNKWVALCLWFFLGVFGGHKFYEGKVGMGILYILTLGLFGIGLLVDLIKILLKPTTYYV